MERVNGIAPSSERWQRPALLLSYTRKKVVQSGFAPASQFGYLTPARTVWTVVSQPLVPPSATLRGC